MASLFNLLKDYNSKTLKASEYRDLSTLFIKVVNTDICIVAGHIERDKDSTEYISIFNNGLCTASLKATTLIVVETTHSKYMNAYIPMRSLLMEPDI